MKCSIFHDLLRIFVALHLFFNIFILKLWIQRVQFEMTFFIFLEIVIFTTLLRLAQHCKTRRWKWQGCIDVVQLCSYQLWNTQCWFDVVWRCKFQSWNTQRCFNVDLTLSHVATSYQPKDNVETILKCLLGGTI